MRVLIVGAGIGGLTAALALRRAGFDAHVYEQAGVLREVGAGVAISPNAVKVLHRLGLAEALRAVGVVSRSLDSRDWQTGALLGRVPLAEAAAARWGPPSTTCTAQTSTTRCAPRSATGTSPSAPNASPSSSATAP